MQIAFIIFTAIATALPLAAQPADPVVDQARSLINSNQDEKAVALMEKAVAAKPNDAVRHFWLANAYGAVAQHGSMFKAISLGSKVGEEFEKAVKLDPNFIEARLSAMEFDLMAPGMMGGGVDKARGQATEIRKRDALSGHRAFAAVAASAKDMNAARAEYAAAIREYPHSPKAHYWYGLFLMLTEKNYKAAAEEFDAALRIDANYKPAHFQIGHLAGLSGANLASGEKALQKYLTTKQADDELPLYRAHYWLGVIYEKQGKKAEARSQFQAALQLRPADGDATQALKRVS